MTRYYIDLNCDMGEGMNTDQAIMPFISSANIACGYHAGDETIIAQTIDYCLQHDVAIGAHPGFADRENFGRKEMLLDEGELYTLVTTQVRLVKKIAEQKGARLHHVKPHGALYNMAATNRQYAATLARAVKEIDPALVFYGLSNSIMLTAAAAAGLQTAAEVFADRSYQDSGQLTPRNLPGALIANTAASVQQVLQLIKQGTVQTITGKMIALAADTVCLHGDGEHAVAFAEAIHDQLVQSGISITHIQSNNTAN